MARLVFLGTPDIAVPALDALVGAGHEVVLVVSRPDARRGRGTGRTPSPVKAAAQRLDLTVTDDLGLVASCGAELGVVVAYGRLIPTSVLTKVPMVNIHFSLLPRWRGAAPLERAILAGDSHTGVCLMAGAPELDTGGVYDFASTPIGDKTLGELRTELAQLGAGLLVHALRDGAATLGRPVEQDGEVTYAAKLRPEEFEIDLRRSAIEVMRTIRLGRAFTFLAGKRLRILEARVSDVGTQEAPGLLDGVMLATGDGVLELLVVQPESRGPMAAADWRRGLGSQRVTLGGTDPAADLGT